MPGKILIIDDNLEYVELLTAILASRGYEIVEAHDGLEGLQKLKEWTPDLIILDINMPRMDGIEFYKKIATRFGRSKFPILVSTARHELGEVFRDIAVDGFLPKPFKINDLLADVEKLVKGEKDPLIYLLAMAASDEAKKLAQTLSSERYRVTIVENLSTLKKAAETKTPDYVILELNQAGASGVEWIQDIKNFSLLKNTPMIVYSHKGAKSFKEKALALGADSVVEDPTAFSEFFQALNHLRLKVH